MSQAPTDTVRIQQEIDSARARMDDRLTQLEGKLSPGQMLDDLMKKFNGSDGGVFARDLMDSVRGAPLPAALTGIGLAWLMASTPKSQQPAAPSRSSGTVSRWSNAEDFDRHLQELDTGVVRQDDEDEAAFAWRRHDARGQSLGVSRLPDDTHTSFGERVQNAVSSTRDALMRTAHDAADQVSALAGKATAAAQSATDQVSETVQALPQMAKDMFATVSANPVVLGAFGLTIGALLGAVIPQTAAEESAFKGVADKLREGASDVAQHVVDKGSELAKDAMSAAGDAAKSAGLTTDKTLGDLAADVSSGNLVQGLKQVAADAVRSVKDGLSETNGSGKV